MAYVQALFAEALEARGGTGSGGGGDWWLFNDAQVPPPPTLSAALSLSPNTRTARQQRAAAAKLCLCLCLDARTLVHLDARTFVTALVWVAVGCDGAMIAPPPPPSTSSSHRRQVSAVRGGFAHVDALGASSAHETPYMLLYHRHR
eukprot:COSAG01_NODE_16469_length_1234_cov_2.251101_3_plen_145_part_01